MPRAPPRANSSPRLQSVLRASRPGPCEVLVRYRGEQARCTLALGADWAIRPTPALIDELEIPGRARGAAAALRPSCRGAGGGLHSTAPAH